MPDHRLQNFRNHPLHQGEGLHPGARTFGLSLTLKFLLSAVPKCFEGETFEHGREKERLAEERRLEEQRRQKA